ncbi:MAG: glycosyltransferase family 39 protein [Maribacter sp.]
MVREFMLSFIENSKSFKGRIVFLYLFLISLFIRFPFFFRDYIDRDESTFILVAQSWVNGNLPYLELWDVKPPLTFLFFATIISIFGKSLFAIRLAGSLLITITAFFTYKIGRKVSTNQVAFYSSIACVALQSMFGSIQGVMSEHICMAFLLPALYIIITRKNWYWLGFAGLLMGISIMVKLNMAYTILFVGLYLIYFFIEKKEYTSGLKGVVAYGTGIILIVIFTWLPYYFQNLHELWWKSVFIAPLDYAGARRYPILKIIPMFLVVGTFFFFAWKKKLLEFKNPAIQILIIAILGVLYSFIKGGRINSHYLIQLYPLLLILASIVLREINLINKIKVPVGYLAFLLLLPIESYLEYYNIAKNKIEKGTLYNGEGFSVPTYIQKNNLETNNILFLGYHIGYWLLDKNPPTKAATHPSNLCKDEMFFAYDNPRKTSLEELRFIMEELRPKTIVVRQGKRIFDKKERVENKYMDAYLSKYYAVHAVIEKAEILQRLEGL